MPNWCSDYIHASFKDPASIDALVSCLINDGGELDFKALIPMPPLIDKLRSGSRVIDDKVVNLWIEESDTLCALTPSEAAEHKQIGFESWYDWSISNWGTKWNAKETYINMQDKEWGSIEIEFDTAWSPPYQIFAKMLELFPDIEFEFRCRLEDDHPYPHEILATDLPDAIRRTRKLLQY